MGEHRMGEESDARLVKLEGPKVVPGKTTQKMSKDLTGCSGFTSTINCNRPTGMRSHIQMSCETLSPSFLYAVGENEVLTLMRAICTNLTCLDVTFHQCRGASRRVLMTIHIPPEPVSRYLVGERTIL